MSRTLTKRRTPTRVCVQCKETFEPARTKNIPDKCLACRLGPLRAINEDDEDDGVAVALLAPARPVEHAMSHDRAVIVGDDLSAFFLRQSWRVRRSA
jgi:hypothetical protein